ncbi:MAG: homocysteine S-methyltransferase family protein [Lachnospirales bacterium]
MENLLNKLGKEIIILDGAMGTTIQNMGLKLGDCPELFNINKPELIKEIYNNYFKSGSNVVTTNTFGANRKKLLHSDLDINLVITRAVEIAKESAKEYNGMVALDIGPIGELVEPMGTLSFDEAYDIFKEQIIIGENAGADIILFETFTDLYELKAGILAAKENSTLPIFATMSFEENGRTFAGCIPSSMAATLTGLGVDALGINCSLGPEQMMPILEEIISSTNLPIIVQPNAGLPIIENGKTVFKLSKEEYTENLVKMVEIGVSIVGGCCGTTYDFIKNLCKGLEGVKVGKRELIKKSFITSHTETIVVDRPRVVGERINPTGKKVFKAALKEENYDYILKIAMEQIDKGANILDVNVSIPDIDEKSAIIKVIKLLQSVTNIPLQIDSSNREVLEAGLRYYNGKPLMNSVNGEEEVLDSLLPIAKKYGAAIVCLTLDKDGIPKTAEGRVKIAKRIMEKAMVYGIQKEDLYIDCLTLTAGAEQEIAAETLKATRLVKEDLGLKTTLGVSNISFGLPNRGEVNRTFLTMALQSGLDLPIINPNHEEMMDVIYCVNQILNIDKGSIEFVNRFANKERKEKIDLSTVEGRNKDIEYYINLGMKAEAKAKCRELIKSEEPLHIVNNILIPILDKIGIKFEKGEIFLPQLISSANASKEAFDVVKEHLIKNEQEVKNEEKIVLATVKGDIHDIGKNIVKVVLENYGYKIIDLGKDVSIEKIVDICEKENIKLVGLSALMTTTIRSMEETIIALRAKNLPTKVMVGGAVVTKEYAENMHADYYSRNAQEAVDIARGVFID